MFKNIEKMTDILLDKNILGIPKKNIIPLVDKTSEEIASVLEEQTLENKNVKALIIYICSHGDGRIIWGAVQLTF